MIHFYIECEQADELEPVYVTDNPKRVTCGECLHVMRATGAVA